MPNTVYVREFVGADAFVVPQNEAPKCFAIGFPPQGAISGFAIKQTGGTPVAAQCDLFNRQVCPLDAAGVSASVAPSGDEDLAKIVPSDELAVDSGQPLVQYWTNPYQYRNVEGSISVRPRRIYLRIDPTTPVDDTTWEVSITCEPASYNN
jgi:hypothetical protein